MQVSITAQEQNDLIIVTTGRGRMKNFLKATGMSQTPFYRMKELGRAEEEFVKKMRSYLKSKEAKKLIEQGNKEVIVP